MYAVNVVWLRVKKNNRRLKSRQAAKSRTLLPRVPSVQYILIL